jgi:hypothetical protein
MKALSSSMRISTNWSALRRSHGSSTGSAGFDRDLRNSATGLGIANLKRVDS